MKRAGFGMAGAASVGRQGVRRRATEYDFVEATRFRTFWATDSV
jgi:hypothetical protein